MITSKMILTYTGTIKETQNVPILWDVIREANYTMEISGAIDYTVRQLIKGINLIDHGYVSHEKSLQLIKNARILLLLIPNSKGKEITTGKIYEYLAAYRPIIGIGPTDGDAADILNETGHGKMIDYQDRQGMKEYLYSLENWME